MRSLAILACEAEFASINFSSANQETRFDSSAFGICLLERRSHHAVFTLISYVPTVLGTQPQCSACPLHCLPVPASTVTPAKGPPTHRNRQPIMGVLCPAAGGR